MDKQSVADLVIDVCQDEARKWRVEGANIVGEVFRTTFRRFNERVVRSPEAYVRTTARREAQRNCKKEKINPHQSLETLGDPFERLSQARVRQGEAPLSQMMAAEERSALQRAIDELPNDLREALFVRTQSQEADWMAMDMPADVSSLAKARGCTRQRIYEMAERALGIVRRVLRKGGLL